MTEPIDPQLDETLADTFARRSRAVGPVIGDLTDVVRRAHHRRTKRRTLTVVASVVLVGVGIGGLLAVGRLGDDGPARTAGVPVSSVPGPGGAWFVCSGERPGDAGEVQYDSCELETPYANPLWSCAGRISDPAVDGDDRPRFESCDAVDEAYEYEFLCGPVTVAPPAPTVPPASAVPCRQPVAPTLPGGATTTSPAYLPTRDTAWPSVPQASVAPTTAVFPASTVPVTLPPLPLESPRVLAIGDSVMRGAADVLQPRGWTVYAAVTLQLGDAVPIVEALADAGVLADTQAVIIHLGTNGTFTADQLDALLAPLANVPNVLLYTIHADREWTAPNNALLRARDRPGDNIALIDWDVRSQECTDNCFAGDGIHLNEPGKRFYADLARDWTGV